MIDKRLKYKEGGPMKKIKGQDHMLAYITPSEKNLLIDLGGQETMTPEGILAYPPSDNYGGTHGSGKSSNTGGTGRPNMADIAGPTPTTTSKPDTKPDARDAYISTMYNNMPTPTVTVGEDKKGNPIEIKTTYTDKRAREQMLDALNAKGISSFDPRVTKKGFNFLDPNNFISSFAPKPKKGFGLLDVALLASGLGLFGAKAKTVGSLVSKGRFALDKSKQITSLANQLGIKNPISNMFSGNNKSKAKSKSTSTSTSKNNTTNNGGNGGDGQGLASIENQAANYDEYILLLQKLQSGNISDAEQNRYNVLKNMLGI